MRVFLCLFFAWLGLAPLPAAAQQDPDAVSRAIRHWLQIQTQDLPGEVSFEVGPVDPNNQLIPCKNFDISRPAGARIWGRSNVLVRCLDAAAWRIYVPVQVRVKTAYLISARPLTRGQVVVADDLGSQVGDLAELPANILTDSHLAIGKAAAQTIPIGRPLRGDMLKAPLAVLQGQTVKVISRGPGFAVTNEGQALSNAAEGQLARVRLHSGQVVSGIAQAGGTVEINF
jgi:flagella basal body P-ring formation protein FlgA